MKETSDSHSEVKKQSHQKTKSSDEKTTFNSSSDLKSDKRMILQS